jgi:5'(3')-deoxyribonucleotidase
MTIKKIYLDMDGVLTDFNRRYAELFGENAAGEDRPDKKNSSNWTEFVMSRQFETLDWFTGGKELLKFVDSLKVPVEILSSTAGPKYHSEVRIQKTNWLAVNFIFYPANLIPGRRVKRFYSYSGNILIDDTPDVTEEFAQYGGQAILHKSAEETIIQLKELMK